MILLRQLFKIKKILQDIQGIKAGNKNMSRYWLSLHHYPKQKLVTISTCTQIYNLKSRHKDNLRMPYTSTEIKKKKKKPLIFSCHLSSLFHFSPSYYTL